MGRLHRRGRDERGAVLAMVGTMTTVLVLMGAFAVDLGVQRVGRRDMQALADVVALDMARQLDGVTKTSVLTSSAAWSTQLTQSVNRNTTTVGDEPTVTAVPGKVDSTTGLFSATTADEIPTAVKVTATSIVHFGFKPGSGGVNRTAVAQTDSNACWALGSYAAALSTSKSALLYPLLGQALGTSLDLTAVGYGGLATSEITLARLVNVSRLNVGTTEELLGTTVSAKNFYLAVADALTADGQTANAAIVQNIAVHIGSVANNVNIGNLLNISQGNSAALGTKLNVFNLLTGAAFLANGTNAIAVQNLALSLPLLGTVSGGLSVIEKPVQTCGKKGSTLHTQQATVGPLSANVASSLLSGISIPGLSTVGVTEPSPISVTASLAGATGTLTNVSCAPSTLTVGVVSELAGAHLSVPLTVTAKVSVAGVIGLVNVVLPVTVKLDTTQSSQTHSATLTPPPFNVKTSTGSGTIGLAGATASITLDSSWTATSVLGVNVKPLATATVNGLLNTILSSLLSSVVTPVANQIDTVLLARLQDLLGLTIAGADVFAREPAPTCNNPVLKGN